MAEVDCLEEFLIILAATLSIVLLFQKMRVSAIVGFFLAGVVIGPGVAVRDGRPLHNTGPEFVVEIGDRLVLLGDHKALDEAARMISPRAPA